MMKMFQKIICMNFLLILIVSGVFGQSYTPPPGSPLANGVHPRMFFTDGSLQDIKQYIDNYESTNFQIYINDMDVIFNENIQNKQRNYILMDAANFAFLSYAVHSGYFSNYTFGHTANEYAQKAFEHIDTLDFRVRNKGEKEAHHCSVLNSSTQGGYLNISIGIVYDWCYEYLSLAQKQQIADLLIYLYSDVRDPDTNPGRQYQLGAGMVECHNGPVGALACYGDSLGGTRGDSLNVMLDMIGWLWYDRIYDMGNHVFEGFVGWGEGASYIMDGHSHTAWFTAALNSAIDRNLFMEYNWLHYRPVHVYFLIEPHYANFDYPNFYFQRNDDSALREWPSIFVYHQLSHPISILKNDDPDIAGFGKWILENSEYNIADYIETASPRVYWLFYKFLWGYKDVITKTPQQIGLKESYRFGLGEVILRSDLTTQNASKIIFYTPKYYVQRHTHRDEAGFVIFKYGTLALDAGNNKSGGNLPKSKFSQMPIYHNILALYPPGDTLYGYSSATNSSADWPGHPDNQPGGANHIGNVISKRFEPGVFDFIDYDYTRTYKGGNYVNYIDRKLLYVRDPNAPNYTDQEYVAIFDKVEVTNSNVKRRWLLHTAFQPIITDGNWNQVSPGFWTTTSGSIINVENSYGNNHGRLFVKILSPDNYELRLRGGDDGTNYYWFTDAEGHDLTIRGPFGNWQANWVGSYRLEIEDLSTGNSSQYLTIMQIGDANTLTSMTNVEKIEAGDFVGALINQDRIVFFNTTTSYKPTISYSFNSNKLVRHIITGLEQGYYYIKINGTLVSGINSFVDEDGVLYFEYNGGGNFAISKSDDTIPPQQPTGLQISK